MSLHLYPFWSINARLDAPELGRQLRELQRLGYDGVVFHPRFYPDQPAYLGDAWMKKLSALILEARQCGLEFWIYDENGWPSGSCGGRLLRRFPEAHQYWLQMEGARRHGRPKICRGNFLDMLDPAASRHFLDLTYERYRRGLDPRAFDHVAGFFTDEPQYGPVEGLAAARHGFIPWTRALPAAFQARYGHDLEKDLPLLFFDGPGCEEVRVEFWELVTDLHYDAFPRLLDQWCRAHGKRLTGHVKGEEHPLFQLMFSGSCPRFFRTLSLPGIDSLERFQTNDFFALELRAAARQFGNGQCLVECFGGAGWGAGPADLLEYLTFFARLGVTHFVVHQSQYRLKSQAIYDWPPSIPFHVPWREAVPAVFRAVRQRLAAAPPAPARALVLAPHRAVMAAYEPWVARATNIHNGANYPDCRAGRITSRFLSDFARLRRRGANVDVIDERTFEESGRSAHATLRVGHASYERLIISDDCRLTGRGEELRQTFAAQGGQMVTLRQAAAETASRIEIRARASRPPVARLAVQWQCPGAVTNRFVLEPRRQGDRFVARFSARCPRAVRLVLFDPAERVLLNRQRLPLHADQEQFVAEIPADQIRRANELVCEQPRIQADGLLFACLAGSFRVVSAAPYRPGPGGTLRTAGPLFLAAAAPAAPAAPDDLVRGGFPFVDQPVVAAATVELPALAAGMSLRLEDCRASAAEMAIDGASLGWAWAPAWEFPLRRAVAAGRHRLRVRLAPAAQNFFGPHHHCDGDPRAVCAAQFVGEKNFLDRPDAPACTRVGAYHFVPFGLGPGLSIGAAVPARD